MACVPFCHPSLPVPHGLLWPPAKGLPSGLCLERFLCLCNDLVQIPFLLLLPALCEHMRDDSIENLGRDRIVTCPKSPRMGGRGARFCEYLVQYSYPLPQISLALGSIGRNCGSLVGSQNPRGDCLDSLW